MRNNYKFRIIIVQLNEPFDSFNTRIVYYTFLEAKNSIWDMWTVNTFLSLTLLKVLYFILFINIEHSAFNK